MGIWRSIGGFGGARSRLVAIALLCLLLAACESGTTTETTGDASATTLADTQAPETESTESSETPTESEPPTTSQSDSGELQQVQFRTDWVPDGKAAPFWLALERGYFEDEGLAVEILDGTGSSVSIQQVTNGDIEFGLAACGATALGIDEGFPVISIAQYLGLTGWGFFVDEGSDIEEIPDLEGHSVLMSPASSESVTMPALFAFLEMDTGAVEQVNVEPSAKVSTYINGEGDAVVTTNNSAGPQIQEGRPSRFLAWPDVGFSLPEYCVIAHKDTVEQDPELVQAFLDGLFRGISEAPDDPDAAVESLVENRPLQEAEVIRAQLDLTFPLYFSENTEGHTHGYHSPEDWTFALETFQQHADLESPIDDLDLFFTNQFFEGN